MEQDLHAKYGPVVRIGPTSLIFSHPTAFEAIYGFNKYFEKGDFYAFARDAHAQADNVFSARTDAAHREHRRKVVGPAFQTSKIAAYEPTVAKNVSILISRLADALPRSIKHGSIAKDHPVLNIAPHVHRYTFETAIAVIYGQSTCSQLYTHADPQTAHQTLALYRNLSKWAWAASLLPWLGWLMSTRVATHLTRRPTRDAQGNLTKLSALAARARHLVFAQPEPPTRAEKGEEKHQASVLQNFQQIPSSNPTHMQPDEIWRECFNLTIAGPGSTAAALTAVLHRLGRAAGRPWQSRIRASFPPPSSFSSSPSSPSSPSPLLLAVIKETLRLHAPFPTGFPREIAPGAETAIPHLGAPLPVGTLVSANSYVLGRSREVWGPEAETWDPARWLVGDEDERREMEGRFVAFGKGPRGCIGKELALLMVAAAVRGVLERWEVDCVDVGLEGAELRGNAFLEMQFDECRVRFLERGDLAGAS